MHCYYIGLISLRPGLGTRQVGDCLGPQPKGGPLAQDQPFINLKEIVFFFFIPKTSVKGPKKISVKGL